MDKVCQIVSKLKPAESSMYAVLSIDAGFAKHISDLQLQVGGGVNAWVLWEGRLQVCRSPARYEHVKDVFTGRSFTEEMADGARFFYCGEHIEIDQEDRYPVEDYALVVSEPTFWFQIWGEKHFQDYYETPEFDCEELKELLEEGRFESGGEGDEEDEEWEGGDC